MILTSILTDGMHLSRTPNARFLQQHPCTAVPNIDFPTSCHFNWNFLHNRFMCAASNWRMLIVLNLWLCNACDRYTQIPESLCMWSRYNNFCYAQYMNRPNSGGMMLALFRICTLTQLTESTEIQPKEELFHASRKVDLKSK